MKMTQQGSPSENKSGECDDTISMMDVLKQEQELHETANAVLGDSDDKNCTYAKGPLPRQALYACSTCCSDGVLAGICLACCYECHEGHDLYELYTKRNFKCDCGNSKFNENKCKLFKDKAAVNESNKYNHNFNGLYCTCDRPYPDPEDEVEDDMVQCIVCEDWYHTRHLGTEVPLCSDFEEMICDSCMATLEFLWPYNISSEAVVIGAEDKNLTAGVDVIGPDAEKSETADVTVAPKEDSDSLKKTTQSDQSDETTDDEECLFTTIQNRIADKKTGATFWPTCWRKKLCRCTKCLAMYKERNVGFITVEHDSVLSYESRGKVKRSSSSEDLGLEALASLDRTTQIEAVHQYNNLKTELTDYLRSFAEEGKVVKEENIKEFFERMNSKRPRVTPPPGYCH